MQREELTSKLLHLQRADFAVAALAAFQYQYEHNAVYRRFADLIGATPQRVNTLAEIPFLPVSAFKHEQVVSGLFEPEREFHSSGTTGQKRSRYFLRSQAWYRTVLLEIFKQFVGDPGQLVIFALMPDEKERPHSSLVFMVRQLIEASGKAWSGFYLNRPQLLAERLVQCEEARQPALLFGIGYALLDFALNHPLPLHIVRVMETGGMKGRREELSRAELHRLLGRAFQQSCILSEYGMTELLSQAYACCAGRFCAPAWMRVIVRDPADPLRLEMKEGDGALNIIDLANLDSCCFLATDDVGRLYADGTFEVWGRLDAAELRGCSLMLAGDSV